LPDSGKGVSKSKNRVYSCGNSSGFTPDSHFKDSPEREIPPKQCKYKVIKFA